jgi:hypothetical protein
MKFHRFIMTIISMKPTINSTQKEHLNQVPCNLFHKPIRLWSSLGLSLSVVGNPLCAKHKELGKWNILDWWNIWWNGLWTCLVYFLNKTFFDNVLCTLPSPEGTSRSTCCSTMDYKLYFGWSTDFTWCENNLRPVFVHKDTAVSMRLSI